MTTNRKNTNETTTDRSAADLMRVFLDFFEDLTVSRFLELVEGRSPRDIQRMLRHVEDAVTFSRDGKPAVQILQIYFDAGDMPHAVEDLDIFLILADEDEEICRDFITDFLHYEAIDWLLRNEPQSNGIQRCPFLS